MDEKKINEAQVAVATKTWSVRWAEWVTVDSAVDLQSPV